MNQQPEIIVNHRVAYRHRVRVSENAWAVLYHLTKLRVRQPAVTIADEMSLIGYPCSIDTLDWLCSQGFVAKADDAPSYVITEIGRLVVGRDREQQQRGRE